MALRLRLHSVAMNASYSMTLVLAVLLLANLGTKLWLAGRQASHVARHRDAVPRAFAG